MDLHGQYTLLADDRSVFSYQSDAFAAFRAHIIWNLILYGGLTFADNQLISSPNLRRLIRDDPLMRTFFEKRRFRLAVRRNFLKEGSSDLEEIYREFVKYDKVQHNLPLTLESSPEVVFAAENSPVVEWDYRRVGENFRTTTKRMLFEQLPSLLSLGPRQVDGLRRIIEAQEHSEEGLGRAFLERRLADLMANEGVAKGPLVQQCINRCADAPYVTNLPKTLGLNPIYAKEHERSFDLVRGGETTREELSAGGKRESRLEERFLVAGLNRLSPDDILRLEDSDDVRDFRSLVARPLITRSEFDDIETLFSLIREQVEAAIVSVEPSVALPKGERLRIEVKKYASASKEPVAVESLVLIFNAVMQSNLPFLGIPMTLYFNQKQRAKQDKQTVRAHRAAEMARKRKLRELEREETESPYKHLSVSTDLFVDAPFSSESIVK